MTESDGKLYFAFFLYVRTLACLGASRRASVIGENATLEIVRVHDLDGLTRQ